ARTEHQKRGSVAKRRRDALIEVIECLDGDTHQHGQRTALSEPTYEEFFKERVDDHPGHGADGYPEAREGVDYLLRVSPSSAARGVPPSDGQVTDRERQHAQKKDAHPPGAHRVPRPSCRARQVSSLAGAAHTRGALDPRLGG